MFLEKISRLDFDKTLCYDLIKTALIRREGIGLKVRTLNPFFEANPVSNELLVQHRNQL